MGALPMVIDALPDLAGELECPRWGCGRAWDRLVTSVHEAGHAVVSEHLGWRVSKIVVAPNGTTGYTQDNSTGGPRSAIVAVAGVQATRRWCDETYGGETDYRMAGDALSGSGRGLDWAEQHAESALNACRVQLLALTRLLYRRGHARTATPRGGQR